MNKIFLSHSSKDKEKYVDPVVRRLDSSIGQSNFIYDKYNFNTNYPMKDQIKNALKDTELFILFLSDNSINSKWVKFEIEEAMNLYNKNIKNICCINFYNDELGKVILNKYGDIIKMEKADNIDEAVNIIIKHYHI